MRNIRRRGATLATTLLFMTFVAIIVAAISTAPLAWDRHAEDSIVVFGIAGMMGGASVGAAVIHPQNVAARTRLFAIFTGAGFGAAAGAMFALPKSGPTLLVGALVLLIFGAVVRRFSA